MVQHHSWDLCWESVLWSVDAESDGDWFLLLARLFRFLDGVSKYFIVNCVWVASHRKMLYVSLSSHVRPSFSKQLPYISSYHRESLLYPSHCLVIADTHHPMILQRYTLA